MRYWAYFAAKLGVAGGALFGLLAMLGWLWPMDPNPSPLAPLANGGQGLAINLALMIWFLICVGTVYLIVWDQRYRCRTCLRRLRMPVETGSWSRMLQLGRPRIEYICVYGHGTLRAEEIQISGLAQPEWTPHSDDMWQELCASAKDSGVDF